MSGKSWKKLVNSLIGFQAKSKGRGGEFGNFWKILKLSSKYSPRSPLVWAQFRTRVPTEQLGSGNGFYVEIKLVRISLLHSRLLPHSVGTQRSNWVWYGDTFMKMLAILMIVYFIENIMMLMLIWLIETNNKDCIMFQFVFYMKHLLHWNSTVKSFDVDEEEESLFERCQCQIGFDGTPLVK